MMHRTLLIGLDGMCFTILNPLIEEGVMPFLGQCMKTGIHGELISTPCPVTPPAWTTIMTGRNPGNHGIFDFITVDPRYTDKIVFRLTNARDILCETIWSIAGRQDRVAGSLNFPQMFLSTPFNGYMIPGFVTSRHLKTSTQPREFWERIKNLPDVNIKDISWDLNEGRKAIGGGLQEEDYKEWIDYLIRKEKGWYAIAIELIEKTPCDLVAVVFEGTDRLLHQVWRLLDPAFMPKNLTSWEKDTREHCLDYFRQLDSMVCELVESAGEDTRIFMVSDHGLGPTTEIFYSNMWLEKHGYLYWKDGVQSDKKGLLSAHNMREHFDSIDWNRTVAYTRTTSANGIYIRVAKEPGQPGIPPEKYASLRSELIESLLSYKDPRTNTPVVTKIMTREEAFPGIAMEEAPDLTLTLRDNGFVSILKADDLVKPRPKVGGTHSPIGIFIAGGKNIRKASALPPQTISDVAPTLLYSMGLPVPEDFEGKVITESFDPGFLKDNPVRIGDATIPPADVFRKDTSDTLKDSDEKQILQRLKDLGYFG